MYFQKKKKKKEEKIKKKNQIHVTNHIPVG